MILLDTHAAIWLAIDKGLGRQSQRIADKALADDRLAISAFSFWELAMLITKKRVRTLRSATSNGRNCCPPGFENYP